MGRELLTALCLVATFAATLAQLDCDFEQGLCQWTQVPKYQDDLDWNILKGATSTSGTGPSNDHTTGTGFYIYLETTLRHENARAQLISPPISLSANQTRCFSFWYHMYGPNVGALNIYTKSGEQPALLWARKGTNGNKWIQARVDISAAKATNLQVILEGVVGNGWKGDIGVDDIALSSQLCKAPATEISPTNSVPVALQCDFEDKKLCGWTLDKNSDHVDWRWHTGGTTTGDTGPAADHTYMTAKGHYLYIEASIARTNSTAQLISPTYQGSQTQCFQFWYSMNGVNVQTLNVYTKTGSDLGPAVWSLSGHPWDQWQTAQITIPKGGNFQIVIEGVKGYGPKGGIAIDDVSLNPGACPDLAIGAVDCNFESNLCGWTQATDDRFNWTRLKGRTDTISTGPEMDHTTGHGYYVYMEASKPQKAGDNAKLVSPILEPAGGSCLEFWYHMLGAHDGILRVYLQTGAALSAPAWKRVGTQGDKWVKASVYVNRTVQYKIVFEGVIGEGYLGDIGLDDITLKSGACAGLTTPAPSGPPSLTLTCNFEQRDICHFEQDKTDQFDWLYSLGGTLTSNTGPSVDHTYGTKAGHYVYVESSSPRVAGEVTRLLSPVIQMRTQGQCLQFWYHMYGQSIGSLSVKLKVNGTLENPLWTLSGNQGNAWRVEQVTLPRASVSKPFQVVFEGVIGLGIHGDIALDDYQVTDGECAAPGTCDFETGPCTWRNVATWDVFDWISHSGLTATVHTGPSTDHTFFNNKGKYMYVEASLPRNPGETCWLVSEMFAPTTGRCIDFWVHMNGKDIGTLNVYLNDISGSKQLIWGLSGDHGDKWINGRAPIKSLRSYQIILEGVIGNGLAGDLAIDDITFPDSTCGVTPGDAKSPGVTTTTTASTTQPSTPVPGPFNCDFEHGACGWAQDKTDQFDWKINFGQTGTMDTGPRVDHTTQHGHYIFIDTSSPRKKGDKARLVGPAQRPFGTSCVQFWYFMFGEHVDTLNVFIKTKPNLDSPIWTKKGDKGNKWLNTQIDVKAKVLYNVVIEAIVGGGIRGDIAIDDISITNGPCFQVSPSQAVPKIATTTTLTPIPSSRVITPSTTPKPEPFNCNFDVDLCGWLQDTEDQSDWTKVQERSVPSETGPDHTSGGGSYLYLKHNSTQTSRLSHARLISPDVPAGMSCLTFWYHMYGTSLDRLRVYVQTGLALPRKPVWTRKHTYGTKWKQASVDLSATPPSKIVFEGVIGEDSLGDIGLDDVTLKPGACTTLTASKPTVLPSLTLTCNFEQRDICGFVQDNADQIDWRYNLGGTPARDDRPSVDHTYGTSAGRYMYVESSVPGMTAFVARLLSPLIETRPRGQCLQFWYHMYGLSIGSLSVKLKVNGTLGNPLWTLSGNQGDTWRVGQVTLARASVSKPFQVVFEGVIGPGYQGNIALDDYQVTDGECLAAVYPAEARTAGVTGQATTNTTPRE